MPLPPKVATLDKMIILAHALAVEADPEGTVSPSSFRGLMDSEREREAQTSADPAPAQAADVCGVLAPSPVLGREDNDELPNRQNHFSLLGAR